jgi:hypothetical protein
LVVAVQVVEIAPQVVIIVVVQEEEGADYVIATALPSLPATLTQL